MVHLAAGDMIPADVRILSCKDLFVIQASLTGESFPVEKFDAQETPAAESPLELKNICFLGTSVESGTATAVVVDTGLDTYLGSMARRHRGPAGPTSFDKGVTRFTWLMIRFMAGHGPAGLPHQRLDQAQLGGGVLLRPGGGRGPDAGDAADDRHGVPVQRAPWPCPRKKVIVKRLNSIQNFGAMDVLCTDKTGTLTMDHVILEQHCDVVRKEDDERVCSWPT